jgi:hypothetical protein
MRLRLASIALVTVALVPAPAHAAHHAKPPAISWQAPEFIDHQPPYNSTRPEVQTDRPVAVSCPSSSLCVALDNSGNVLSTNAPLSGTGWRIVHLENLVVPLFPNNSLAISCPSVHLCVATDSDGNVLWSRDPGGGARAWRRVHLLKITPSPIPSANDIGFAGVSCPSVGLCVAVDGSGEVLTSTHPTGTRSAWKALSIDLNQTIVGALSGISCPSTKFCMASNSSGNVVISRDPGARHPSWMTSNTGTSARLTAISCASPSLCVVADGSGVRSSTAPTRGPSSWTAANVDSSPVANIDGLACIGSSLCVAIDSLGSVFASTDPGAGAPTWSNAASDPAADGQIPPVPGGAGMSCMSATACVGVDAFGSALTYNTTASPPAWRLTQIDGSNPINAVSCQAGPCVAVDAAGDVLTSDRPAQTDSWSFRNVDSHALSAVTCPSAQLCAAVDSAGNVVTSTDPMSADATWTVADADAAAPLTSISCPAARLCAAVDGDGNVVTSTNPAGGAAAWSAAYVDDTLTSDGSSSQLTGVSCPTTLLCVAVDSAGNIVSSSDPTGGASAWTVWAIGSAGFTSVTCTSAALCVAVSPGDLFTSTVPGGGGSDWSSAPQTEGISQMLCLSRSECLGLASPTWGDVLTTMDPLAPHPRWTTAAADRYPLNSISCNANLCAAVDGVGQVVIGERRRDGPTAR